MLYDEWKNPPIIITNAISKVRIAAYHVSFISPSSRQNTASFVQSSSFQALKVFRTTVYKEIYQGSWPALMGKILLSNATIILLWCLLQMNDHDLQGNPSTLVLSKLSWDLRGLEGGS